MVKLFILVSCCSVLWNYSIPQRYRRYEEGRILCGRRMIRLFFMKAGGKIGAETAREFTIAALFSTWLVLCGYFAAAACYFNVIGIKIVALLAAALNTFAFWQDIGHIHRNFAEWCYSQEDNIILVTKGCWEIVLAGLILVHLFLYK